MQIARFGPTGCEAKADFASLLQPCALPCLVAASVCKRGKPWL
jgi:hypothetical protein